MAAKEPIAEDAPRAPSGGASHDLGVEADKWRRWMIAAAVMSAAVMELVDTSAINVSLPYIAGNLSASVDQATWVLTSYLVANAVILPLSGWLANQFGRKRLLLMSVTGFAMASILCGLAPTLPALVFFRVLQGAAGGSLQPTSRAILLETFPREERGQAMALWGVGIVIAPILAPVLGGWLTTDYSWRWVFFLNVPISLLGIFMVRTFISDPPYIRRASTRIDYWGMGLLAIGVMALQVVFDRGQQDDWFGSHFIVALSIIAVVCLTAFTVWELHTRHPVVHFRLFRYRTFAAGTGLSMLLFFALYGSIVLLPLFMQELLGFPAVTAGIWNSPRGLATMMMMPLAGYLIGRRWDMRVLLSLGLAVSAVGVFLFSHLSLNAGPWNFVLPEMVMGAGLSFMFVPLATITVHPIPQQEMGYATSLIALARNLGAGIGISVFTAFEQHRKQFHQARLAASITPERHLPSGLLAEAGGKLRHGSVTAAGAPHRTLAFLYHRLLEHASTLSYLDGFRLMAILMLAAIPLVWIMRKPAASRAQG